MWITNNTENIIKLEIVFGSPEDPDAGTLILEKDESKHLSIPNMSISIIEIK